MLAVALTTHRRARHGRPTKLAPACAHTWHTAARCAHQRAAPHRATPAAREVLQRAHRCRLLQEQSLPSPRSLRAQHVAAQTATSARGAATPPARERPQSPPKGLIVCGALLWSNPLPLVLLQAASAGVQPPAVFYAIFLTGLFA